MADKKESDAQRKAREAGEQAQESAESGESGSVTDREPYSGGAQHGDSCTLTDGRPGKVEHTPAGNYCVASEDDED